MELQIPLLKKLCQKLRHAIIEEVKHLVKSECQTYATLFPKSGPFCVIPHQVI